MTQGVRREGGLSGVGGYEDILREVEGVRRKEWEGMRRGSGRV